jgi:hypothetical protein
VDWVDPNTWKVPATLIDNWRTILVGAVAIVGAVGSVLQWGLKPVRWAWSKLPQRSPQPNINRPLRFVQDERQSFWGPARRGEEPGTQVAGHWHVTNTSDRNVVLLRVRLDGYQSDVSNVATEGLRDRLYSSTYSIPAHRMARVTANLMCYPPIATGQEPLVADVIFTDNFEDEHRVRSRFRSIRA